MLQFSFAYTTLRTSGKGSEGLPSDGDAFQTSSSLRAGPTIDGDIFANEQVGWAG